MIRKMRLLISLLALVVVALSQSGCSSFGQKLKSFLGGKSSGMDKEVPRSGAPRFSENENVRTPVARQYKRMNKQKFEEEAEVNAEAGSLWVMEGQGAYLFAQNQIRQVGDILNINIEGGPKAQLQTKVKVVSKLLERLDRPVVRAPAAAAPAQGQAPGAAAQGAQGAQPGQPGAQAQNAAGGPGAAPPAEEAKKDEPKFEVTAVPARIVEILRDGSYRVRGTQPFMIGKREYRVIVTGLVRPEDFNEEGTSAAKLLDAQFDIVSVKKVGT